MEVPVEVAECFCCGGELRVLRLVGLAFSAAHRFYLVMFVGQWNVDAKG